MKGSKEYEWCGVEWNGWVKLKLITTLIDGKSQPKRRTSEGWKDEVKVVQGNNKRKPAIRSEIGKRERDDVDKNWVSEVGRLSNGGR